MVVKEYSAGDNQISEQISDAICAICRGKYTITVCTTFAAKPVDEQCELAKTNQTYVRNSKYRFNKENCSRQHHRLLHKEKCEMNKPTGISCK